MIVFRFRGFVYPTNQLLQLSRMFLNLANFAEARLTGSDDSEKPEILAKMREYYNDAAECLGFKDMKSLLRYQAKWGTDIVHNINERALE